MDVPLEARERWREAMAEKYSAGAIRRSESIAELESYLATTGVLDDCGTVDVSTSSSGPWEALGDVAHPQTVRRLVRRASVTGGIWYRAQAAGVQLGVWHRLWFAGFQLEHEDDDRVMRVNDLGEMSLYAKGGVKVVSFREWSRDEERFPVVAHLVVGHAIRYADAIYKVPQEDNAYSTGGRSMPFIATGETVEEREAAYAARVAEHERQLAAMTARRA